MNTGIPGTALAAAGLATAYAGWRVIRSQEHPPGTTGFEGPGLNARGWKMLAGELLLVGGLILAAVIGPMLILGG